MDVRDLDPDEQLVLVGLVKAVVHADQFVSVQESERIAELADALGPELWNRRVNEARERLATADDLFQLAKGITRAEARVAIHGILCEVAATDRIDDQEAQILDWLAEVWQLGGIAADGGEWDEEDSDEGTFSDEFILFDPTEDA